MKISVSNITWGKNNFEQFLDLIKENHCQGVELAPSLIWDEPKNANRSDIKIIQELLEKRDLEFVGFHSLLFNRPELLIFKKETRNNTIEYLKMLIDICSKLKGKQVVFGSPRNRVLCGKNLLECKRQAKEDFLKISDYCEKKNVIFCLEPLSINETEFITSLEEGGEFVNEIDHNFFKLHLDTKSIYETKEDPDTIIEKYKKIIQHVHVGDSGLREPGIVNNNHKNIGKALHKINYNKYVSLEFKKNEIDMKKSITSSIKFVKANYIF